MQQLPHDPLKLFSEWYEEVSQSSFITLPNAAALATASLSAKPSVRIILMKAFDEKGFVFYTNLMSQKGKDLSENPQAALCFYWPGTPDRQVRIEGKTELVSQEEADKYFASRIRESQIAAWASNQSQKLASPTVLQKRVEEYQEKFKNLVVPRPDFWTGIRIKPEMIEFWIAGDYRLHERICYVKAQNGQWEHYYLNP